MSVPTLERLRADLGERYLLVAEDGSGLPAQLCDVTLGLPMSQSYVCYSAQLALPAGAQLPQLSCTVLAGTERWEHLLLTPVGSDAQGRQRMQMVFHCPAPGAPENT